jgi:class 3 adenylate cyclase/pimeloyl-ACP methyl ester carboxylesterase
MTELAIPPETAYATAPDGTNIAYQVVGDGPDLLFVPGWISNLDLFWEAPASRRFFSRLASFSRLIIFDKRGTGLSDPIQDAAPIEVRAEDISAVLDAAGSEETVVSGYSEGAATAAFFAATYPERTTKLILAEGGMSPSRYSSLYTAEIRAEIAAEWGQGALMDLFLPNHVDDRRARANWAKAQRQSCTRGMALKYWDLLGELDAVHVLPNVRVPTLVLCRTEDPILPFEYQRDLAERIPDAELLGMPGNDHLLWLGDWEGVCDAYQEFITGRRPQPRTSRQLATVLFTDIVGSTELAEQVGDGRWREMLNEHDRICRQELEGAGGRLIKTMGDGALATFEGPAAGIRTACAIRDSVAEAGVKIRAGLHTGEIELMNGDIGGMAVHIAARVSAEADADEVLVSRTVKDLIAGSGVRLADRGTHTLKGIPDEWNLYAVEEA